MVHGKKERKKEIIIIKNGAKTISLQTTFGRLKYQYLKYQKENNKKTVIITMKY